MTPDEAPSFPRQQARTQRFTLGRPRTFTVSPDGARVLFIRSADGADRVGRLWCRDTVSGDETLLADPAALLGDTAEDLSHEEQARRERMREAAGGVVGYATDEAVRQACFTLSGRLFVVDIGTGTVRELPARTPVIDPRLDPTGRHVAYSSGGTLRVCTLEDVDDRRVAGAVEGDGSDVTYGLADFVAAEELGRSRGYWWSPDGDRLLVARVDDSPVPVWYVSDPAHPDRPSTPQRYPAAGSANAEVSLWLVGLDGDRTAVTWDRDRAEYLASVHWSSRGTPLVQVLDRAQGHSQVLRVDAATGATSLLRERTDPCWVDVVPGAPAWGPSGELLTVEVADDRYALCVDGRPVDSPEDLDVRAVLDVGPTDVLLLADDRPAEQHVWRWSGAGLEPVTSRPGVHTAARGGGTVVTVSADLDHPLPRAQVTAHGRAAEVASFAEVPALRPAVTILPGGRSAPRVAVVLPRGHAPGSGPLPVLLDPYGGPHARQVLRTQAAFRESQWFADQGFAVVVVDGRGTPGSPSWERMVRFDLAGGVLDDQETGLRSAADAFPDLDLTRVAIRGWSFGGYLSALAVLRRPAVFHAAVAGAPVTEWRWYDTGYTERYLGLPDQHPDAYDRCSLLPGAASLSRPLMLVHGFADDNVFVTHTLRLSAELTAAGRPHTLLPLSGVTHMTNREDVAENLLRLQVDFLRQALGAST
jgi:dipeptidyl-peptidase-4